MAIPFLYSFAMAYRIENGPRKLLSENAVYICTEFIRICKSTIKSWRICREEIPALYSDRNREENRKSVDRKNEKQDFFMKKMSLFTKWTVTKEEEETWRKLCMNSRWRRHSALGPEQRKLELKGQIHAQLKGQSLKIFHITPFIIWREKNWSFALKSPSDDTPMVTHKEQKCKLFRARICKRLRSPGIDSKESNPPA